MAFIAPILPINSGFHRECHSGLRRSHVKTRVVASAKRPSNDKADFTPFDGSQPLLPPWRPPSLEADFTYSARRLVHRARHMEAPTRLVRLESPGYATLFARVVQNVTSPDGTKRVWLRPLLLDAPTGGFVDVRGGTDLVLPDHLISDDVQGEMYTRVVANLAATEGDVEARAVNDDGDGIDTSARTALMEFVRKVSGQDGEESDE